MALLGQYPVVERLQRGSRERAKPIQDRMDAINALRFEELTQVRAKRKKRGPLSATAMKNQVQKLRERQSSQLQAVADTPASAIDGN